MAYISIIVPAFYTRETDESEIKKICCAQFEKTPDEYELIKINDKSEYAIKFKQSDFSLNKIENLIYQRDCIKSLVEKTFESLQSMTDKFYTMERELKLSLQSKNEETNCSTTHNINDNQKLKNLLTLQLENSENFRMNTEKTLNRIKEEFQQMELDVLRKQTSKHKSVKSMDLQVKNYQKRSSESNYSNNKKNVSQLKLNK